MNILFFLTPKSEVAYIEENDSLRQALEKMEYHKYTAIPILNRRGQYVRTLTEGDLLRVIKKQYSMNLQEDPVQMAVRTGEHQLQYRRPCDGIHAAELCSRG